LKAGHDARVLRVAVSGHLHVQKNSQKARDDFYPYYSSYMKHNLPNRHQGWQISRADYEHLASPLGSLFVGSTQEIIDKICYEHELFGHDRFLAQIDIGGQPFSHVANSIELLATEVLPGVQKALMSSKPAIQI
jgi:alkanesulfonate monooxygenase SsuD/methylene tetrahydromethanopterin reductase-like flavin-dependent oxidoreductase (luciferase family)